MDERMHNAASKRAAKRVGRKASGRSSCASISHTSPSLSAKRLPSLSLPICHRRKKRKRVPKPNRWSTRPGRPWRKSHDTCSRGPRKIKKRAMSLIHVHNQLRLLLLLLLLLGASFTCAILRSASCSSSSSSSSSTWTDLIFDNDKALLSVLRQIHDKTKQRVAKMEE